MLTSILMKATCAHSLLIAVFAQAQPVITQHPQSQEVSADRYISLYVTATGTTPMSYQWFYNDDPVPGATYSSFSRRMTPELAGNYSVLVSNETGTVMSDPAIVTVRVYPPLITSQPTNASVFEGQTAQLSVVADGAPYPTYQWYFNDVAIPTEAGSSLTVTSALPQNAGTYFVVISNSEGSITSSPAALVVATAKG